MTESDPQPGAGTAGAEPSAERTVTDGAGPAARGPAGPDTGGATGIERDSTYTESPIIMTTVRVVTPFVFTYGLFITFHGADSPGGGFQGGAVMATVVLMLAFAFGIDATREWLRNSVLIGLATGGVIAFAGIGLGALALGGRFLDYREYGPVLDPLVHLKPAKLIKYGMEGVEIFGIAAIVTGAIVGLFFATDAGFDAAGFDESGFDEARFEESGGDER